MDNNTLTDEEKRAKKLEQLAKAREKAVEKRKMLGELTRQEKQVKEDVVKDRIKKLQMLKEATKPAPVESEDDEEETPKTSKKSVAPKGKKKVVKKVIEVSDSSSDDASDSSSDDEPQVEYVVRRTKKAPAKPQKQAKGKREDYEDYDTPKLSAEVAKSVLKKRVMDDAHTIAFQSLFPYHNF